MDGERIKGEGNGIGQVMKKDSSGKRLYEVLKVSVKLGLTSFGGPSAHLGYFHEEYVRRRKWLDEQSYADLVALCQFLPGPASSQVGIGIGAMRAGWLGGLLAFIGFTLPSVIALMLFALVMDGQHVQQAEWIHGLKLVAVAVVVHAVWGMAQKLASTKPTVTIAVVSAAVSLLWPSAWTQAGVIAIAGLSALLLFGRAPAGERPAAQPMLTGVSPTAGILCLALFFGLLVLLPFLRGTSEWIAMFDSFYRSGSLVFGGGHVVLPLLERELVPAGFISEEAFLAGYGATQAVPGPMFTFASYLGAVMKGWAGGLLATAAIFLPAFLLVFGTLPFWDQLRRIPAIRTMLVGINAAVVGILLAALYDPIWTGTITSSLDFVIASVLFLLLAFWKLPPWAIVLLGAVTGWLPGMLG